MGSARDKDVQPAGLNRQTLALMAVPAIVCVALVALILRPQNGGADPVSDDAVHVVVIRVDPGQPPFAYSETINGVRITRMFLPDVEQAKKASASLEDFSLLDVDKHH